MPLLDLKKQYAKVYKPSSKAPSFVDVPPMRFLMLEGEGGTSKPAYTDAVQSLMGLAYATKFEAAKRLDLSYPVMPLQALLWNPSDPDARVTSSSQMLAWQLMVLIPEPVTAEFVDIVRDKVRAKKSLARLDDVRVQTFTEGVCVQVLHLGPYAAETRAVDRMSTFAAERGYQISGRRHEIYLSDEKTAPEKLRTILRFGIRKRRNT